MNIEVKNYLTIGMSRLMNIKVYEYDKVKDLAKLEGVTPLYEGSVEDAPQDIKDKTYVKCELGNPTIYYV